MPPRTSFKADASFFEKIAIGVIGAEAVQRELSSFGHQVIELERGALDTKLWKDVKRKRVRIPDLVCSKCGQRIESRAKTRPELSMSHSPGDSERAWDSGMMPDDWIAFPICESISRREWSQGQLAHGDSYWHERRWSHWRSEGAINIFSVGSFRKSLPKPKPAKGVTEGSETQVFWPAIFSRQKGKITRIESGVIRYVGYGEAKERFLRLSRSSGEILSPAVVEGEQIRQHQVIAAAVSPLGAKEISCRGGLTEDGVASMLRSRQQTVRYTGCRLAKVLRHGSLLALLSDLARDPAEDIYTRLEARSYLVSVSGRDARDEFGDFLAPSVDDSWRLESIVALADTSSSSALELLKSVLQDQDSPFFLRAASAWALSHFPGEEAASALVSTFDSLELDLRREAMMALVKSGGSTLGPAMRGLVEGSSDVAAGCFEALRRIGTVPVETLKDFAEGGRNPEWVLWLLAGLPRSRVMPTISAWQRSRPDLYFALSVLWSFFESWVSELWEVNPGPRA